MSIYCEISSLEKDVNEGNYELLDKIVKIRNLFSNLTEDQISQNEAKTLALHIWNLAVRLQRNLPSSSVSEKETLQKSIIPSLRILAGDIYQKFIDENNENDVNQLFNIISYTYKSLLDADNIGYANQYYDLAFNLYSQLNLSSMSALILIQLIIWKVQYDIAHDNNYDKALELLKEFTSKYKIESSLLISFVYEKSLECQSYDWISFCHSLISSSSAIPDVWKNQIESLLAQFYINNNNPEEALNIIAKLPKSVQSLCLEIKCLVLLQSEYEIIKEKLTSFISQMKDNLNYLTDLTTFISTHSNNIGHLSIEYITEVMNLILTFPEFENKEQIFIGSIRIACDNNDIESAKHFLSKINTNECRKELVGLLWNKALDMFDMNEYEQSAEWMELSRTRISDTDNESQSAHFRFISRCYLESSKYEKALSYSNDSIQRTPNCCHGYLLKYRALVKMGNEKDAFEFVSGEIINSSSPYIEEFEPAFFMSLASEIHSIGNITLALECLLKLYELNFNSKIVDGPPVEHEIFVKIRKNTISSIFALLKTIEDVPYVAKVIKRLSSRWNSQVIYDDFSPNEIAAFCSIAYKNGIKLKEKAKWKKAINSFLSGSIFGGELIESKAPCVFEMVDCYINLSAQAIKSASSEENPILSTKNLIDEIAPLIEKSPGIDQKYKDGLLLSKIKISVILFDSQKSESMLRHTVELIELITSPNVLYEICIFVSSFNINELFFKLLDVAKVIDSKSLDEPPNSLTAALLYQLISSSKTLDDSKKSFELVLEFLSGDNRQMLNFSQFQFFMARAWNIGVQCAKGLRSVEAEWWLKTALTIMAMNEELKTQYEEELNQKYLQFLVRNKNRIAFSF